MPDVDGQSVAIQFDLVVDPVAVAEEKKHFFRQPFVILEEDIADGRQQACPAPSHLGHRAHPGAAMGAAPASNCRTYCAASAVRSVFPETLVGSSAALT